MSQRRGVVDSVGTRATEVAKEDLSKARVLVNDAARSGSYMYGIVYFFSHRSLWKPFWNKLAPMLTLSAGVLAGMFAFTYLPQLAIMVFVDGPVAVLSTVLLVLNESSTIVSSVSRSWVLQDALLDTFDGTLVAKNATNLVKNGRELKSGSDPMAKLGKILKSPFERFSPKALIRYLMYLPFNFIPIVGTAVFVGLQGRTRGKSVHDRYFQLKSWSRSQREDWLQEHVGAYTAFGTVATLLEMIPFAGIFFSFTNTVGAALWAADIEAKNTAMLETTAPGLREVAEQAEKE
ncbi:hypothetical protein BD289DRAFT_377472 [Coniella lustricola]|uniref:Outer spore wall protein RRT8 n=1 Tax=Coniella lustricola TaxID=2025994 RepID=A0A2T2ZVE5_9PEZI|nr:hypothetical protein BD289DRAFT_377472 [Coniella lustricola]